MSSRPSLEIFAYDVVEHAPDALVLTTLDGSILEAGAVARTLFERPRAQLVGRVLASFLGADARDSIESALVRAREGRSSERVVHLRLRGGSPNVKVAIAVSRLGTRDVLLWRLRPMQARHRILPGPLPERKIVERSFALQLVVVTQDPEVVEIVRVVSSERDAVVHVAVAVDEALERIATIEAPVIVADLGVRSATDLDVLSETRRQRRRRVWPASIAVSTRQSPFEANAAFVAGYHAFLLKPLTLHAFKSAMSVAHRILDARARRHTSGGSISRS